MPSEIELDQLVVWLRDNMHLPHVADVIEELRARIPYNHAVVSKKPTSGLLMSMAICYDHALGMPGYYDSEMWKKPNGVSHAQRLKNTISIMRQLHEEVVGTGFYAPNREKYYRDSMRQSGALPLEDLE